jgi:hypothetical protein
MSRSNTAAKIGAVGFLTWGCLHLQTAYSVYLLGRSLDSPIVQARVLQDAWNLLCFSIVAISVAATLNWKNSLAGFWINFFTLAIADIGFLAFVVVPGLAPVWPGLLGPASWTIATAFSAIALLNRPSSVGHWQVGEVSR